MITQLNPGEVFVFGSNLAGRHGKGAALTAKQRFGAKQGQGEGMQGWSYAIPTKDERLRVLPLSSIEWHVQKFLVYAENHPEFKFLVTEIGCGLAGYTPGQIGPFFDEPLKNVVLPVPFRRDFIQKFRDKIVLLNCGCGKQLSYSIGSMTHHCVGCDMGWMVDSETKAQRPVIRKRDFMGCIYVWDCEEI